jgi:glucokinase
MARHQLSIGPAAILVGQDSAHFQHVETEAGHCAFAPVGDAERTLHANLDRVKSPVSWERALFAAPDDAAWRDTPVASDPKRIAIHRAEILGSFVGDMILATGAWDGVMLFGNAGPLLSSPAALAAFDKRIETRANYQVQLRRVPRWLVTMPNINLVGVGRYLQQRCEGEMSMA